MLWDELQDVADVLTLGAEKYDDTNYLKIDPYFDSHFAAAMRHLVAWRRGEKIDPETGVSSLAHAISRILFLMHGDKNVLKVVGPDR